MNINFSSLRACFGVQSANSAIAPTESTPRQSGFCRTVASLCKGFFQCKSSFANTIGSQANNLAPTPTAGDANNTVSQDALQLQVGDLFLKGLDHKLEPEIRERLLVAFSMTKAWGNQPEDPMTQLARAPSPESLPDPQQLLTKLGLQSGKTNVESLKTFCGLIQKKIYPMISQVLDNPGDATGATQLGTWLCEVFAQVEPLHNVERLEHLAEPMLDEFIRLLDSPLSQVDVNNDQLVVRTQIKNALLANKVVRNIKLNVMIGGGNQVSHAQLPDQQKQDKMVAMAVARVRHWCCIHFKNFSPEVRADRLVALAAINTEANMIKYVGPDLKADKEVVLAAVKNSGLAIEFAHENLKNDRDVVMQACIENSEAFKFASSELKQDRAFVLELVRKAGVQLEQVAPELREDNEIVESAAIRNFLISNFVANPAELTTREMEASEPEMQTLSQASEEIRDNYDSVLAAVLENPDQLKYASSRIKNDKDFVKMALFPETGLPSLLDMPQYKADREIVKATVSRDGMQLQYADIKLRNNRDIVIAAVTQNVKALRFASSTLLSNTEVIKAAVLGNGLLLELANTRLRNNPEIVSAAIRQNGEALKFASNKLKGDKAVVMAAYLQNPKSLKYASSKLKNDAAFVREMFIESQKYKHIAPD